MIKATDLTKLYPNGKGIKNLNFEIPEGMTFGYLGPNGAGKTTTIRNLLGFLKPNQGRCTIKGFDCWKDASKIQNFLGYIPGEIAFIDGYTGNVFLNVLCDMRNIKNSNRRDMLVERFNLETKGKIKHMSKGMKQKLAIIAACMHDPEIMVFDEPSAGLDPLMRNIFVEFILEEKRRGKTILMSSHSFEEIDRTCDKAGVIHEGTLVDIQDIEILKEKQCKAFIITLSDSSQAQSFSREAFEIKYIKDNQIEITIQGEIDPLIKVLSKYTVLNLQTSTMSLEQVFMQYFNKEGSR